MSTFFRKKLSFQFFHIIADLTVNFYAVFRLALDEAEKAVGDFVGVDWRISCRIIDQNLISAIRIFASGFEIVDHQPFGVNRKFFAFDFFDIIFYFLATGFVFFNNLALNALFL